MAIDHKYPAPTLGCRFVFIEKLFERLAKNGYVQMRYVRLHLHKCFYRAMNGKINS